jgi:ATP-dependent DNA helicase RecG
LTDSVRLVWFNQSYRAASLKHDHPYYISGQYELGRTGRFAVMNPSVESVSDFPANTARIVPIYRETKDLTSRQIRQLLIQCLDLINKLKEDMPAWLLSSHKLLSLSQATAAMHFPDNPKQLEAAKLRLGFEEVFSLSLASLLNKYENKSERSASVKFNKSLAQQFVASLPFKLTNGQKVAIWQIYKDMERAYPMNRLVEGDVGSGKTVVATMAALMAIKNGQQVAFMAPTELLATQHGDTIQSLLEPLGLDKQLTLLVGSMNARQKSLAKKAITSGQAKFIIGTHALIQEKVAMDNLALVIIDEQHRFGVAQRKVLMSKARHMPHVLSLSATPIPRSLALTLYGELDVSRLTEKPAGRKHIDTKIVTIAQRERLYHQMDSLLEAGQQMFVVCPAIKESETADVKAAEAVYEKLKSKDFKHRRVGLLHGKLKAVDKKAVMDRFILGKIDILVATTVIEVGVDIPNAAIMMIRNPERFGLAQLHQLRGRVGRSDMQGYCYLMLEDNSPPTKRLRAMVSSNDGFKLAEYDLSLRGPGAIYGTSQHGALDLRVANLSDLELIKSARAAAQKFIDKDEDLLQYKQLARRVNRLRAVTNLN